MTQSFGVFLMKFPEHKNFAEKTVAILVQMSTTYLCKESFSVLLRSSQKKETQYSTLM